MGGNEMGRFVSPVVSPPFFEGVAIARKPERVGAGARGDPLSGIYIILSGDAVKSL
jgi:hypothetical protein